MQATLCCLAEVGISVAMIQEVARFPAERPIAWSRDW